MEKIRNETNEIGYNISEAFLNTALKSAKWIGSPYPGVNTWNLETYQLRGRFLKSEAENTSVVFGARDVDNYLKISFQCKEEGKKEERIESRIKSVLWEHTDLAFKGMALEQERYARENGYEWKENHWVKKLAEYQGKSNAEIPQEEFVYEISVNRKNLSIMINNQQLCCGETVLPEALPTEPRKSRQMMTGIKKNKRLELRDQVPPVTVGKWIQIENLAQLKKAVLLSTARGFYESYLNGMKIGDEYYAPGFTDYRLHIDYQENDITEMIKSCGIAKSAMPRTAAQKAIESESAGKSVFLSAIVTRGYYAGFCGYSGAENYGRENSYLACLVLEYEDGTKKIEATDESWLYTENTHVLAADYLDGEYQDARNRDEIKGWHMENWISCGVKEAPGLPVPSNGSFDTEVQPEFILQKQQYEGAKVREILKPISVTEAPKGHFVYDFGQNMVGTIQIKLHAEAGKAFRVRYGEMNYKNGEIYIQNIRTAANNDIYICAGEEDIFEPRFTSHGFRYVEITGAGWRMEDNACIESLEGRVLHNLSEKAGDFECSDAVLNRLQKNICWGQKGNFLLIPTDCPQRNERMGWTGDAQVFASTAAFNMNVKEFMEKWLQDLREATLMYNMDGAIPDTAPLGGDNRPGPCGGWSDAAVIVPWELYEEYADKKILADSYEMMKGWIAYQMRADRESAEGIQLERRRGDHLAYDTSTPFELCATAYAARCADYMARTADVLGFIQDAQKYGERFAYLRKCFAKKWVSENGDLTEKSQTSYALAIDFGLVSGTLSEEQLAFARKYHTLSSINLEETVSPHLIQGFIQAVHEREDHLSVGFLGISHLLPALSKIDQDELAAKVLMNPTEPGWLYSVLNGATTIWERWNSYIEETGEFGDVNMNSFNHYAYGSVGAWIYEHILGIKRLSPGYGRIKIEPKALGGITWARGYHDTVNGRIAVEWKLENGELKTTASYPNHIQAEKQRERTNRTINNK